jgi:hypothetical protein
MKKKEGKAYFYKLDAAEFMAEVFQIPDGCHKEWVSRLALDLVAAQGNTTYSQKLIREVAEFREKMSKAGKTGMDARYGNKTKHLRSVT